MKQFEYALLNFKKAINHDETENKTYIWNFNGEEIALSSSLLSTKDLNKLGENGWELIICRMGGVYIFKREKNEDLSKANELIKEAYKSQAKDGMTYQEFLEETIVAQQNFIDYIQKELDIESQLRKLNQDKSDIKNAMERCRFGLYTNDENKNIPFEGYKRKGYFER